MKAKDLILALQVIDPEEDLYIDGFYLDDPKLIVESWRG